MLTALKTSGPALRPSLLLVEDDEVLSSVLARQLAQQGFSVDVAHDCAAATAALAHQQPPSHALVDLRLPDGNGLRLVSVLRDANPLMKVVVLTGFGSIVSAIDAVKRGAVYYLCKPARVHDIMAAFDHVVEPAEPVAPIQLPSAKRVEWEHIQRVLAQNRGCIAATARALNMHRRTLQRKLQKHPPYV